MNYIVDDYKVALQDTTQDFVEFVMTGDLWDGWGAGAISAAFGASYRSEELDQSTPDPTDEFPATPSGVLLETLGVVPAGCRGLIEEHQLPGGLRSGSGIRNVPAGFRGDANSSSITFSSLRAISGGYDVRDVFGELNIPIASRRRLGESVRHQHGGTLGRLFGQRRDLGRQARHELAGHGRGAAARDAVARRARRDAARALRPDARRRHGQDPLKGGASISTASFSGGNPNVNPGEGRHDDGRHRVPADGRRRALGVVRLVQHRHQRRDRAARLAGRRQRLRPDGNQSLCEFVIRDPVNNDIVRVDNLFINLQRQVIEGTDLELTLRVRQFQSAHVRHAAHGELGAEPRRLASTIAPATSAAPMPGLPDTKVTANLSWSRGPFSLFVQERYIGGGKLDRFLIEGDRTLIAQLGLPSDYSTIDDNSIDSTYYTDLGVRFAFGRDDAWEIFGNINNLFDQEPRATAQILGRAGVNEFNQAANLYDVLGRTMVVGARLTF